MKRFADRRDRRVVSVEITAVVVNWAALGSWCVPCGLIRETFVPVLPRQPDWRRRTVINKYIKVRLARTRGTILAHSMEGACISLSLERFCFLSENRKLVTLSLGVRTTSELVSKGLSRPGLSAPPKTLHFTTALPESRIN